ncbi:MAG TPA: aminotransferase class V-fold PLP-dependent enzyme [Thermoanaerobaculia bacterium]|jgi:L-2,4-diaminobutyrate decarboxylase|nr:aminotransferase class V-fold PLP-dependent enzyme [Thermoanaerobaculia bacterium]
MRALAHQTVDALFDHVENIAGRRVVDWQTSDELRARVRIDDGGGAEGMALVSLLIDNAIQLHHPSYMGHQVCPPFPTAVIADLVISTLNQSTAVFEMSPIGTVIEQEVVRWLADRAGYPATSLGTAVSGGSAANLTALLAARARWNAKRESGVGGRVWESGQSPTPHTPPPTPSRPIILCSADAHYSIARAASIMGIAAEDVIKVATDDQHRLDLQALDATLRETEVMAIVATSGSTATGAFDDLRAIAALRDKYDTWLHVDAAHGASVVLSERLRPLVDGLDLADSLAWDPHKMLWMSLSLGVILVRDGRWLRRAFEADAPYLFNAERASDNIGEMTIQCSKRADAIKLWLTLQMFGTQPFVDAMEHVTDLTRYLYDLVAASSDFEAMHVPQFNIFCFRHRSDDDSNAALREKLIRSGQAWITSTVLKGQRVLRVTMINPRTEREDVDRMVAVLRRFAGDGLSS